MKVMIINGSVREGRAADAVQKWLVGELQQDTSLELDVVDLKEVDLPFFDEPVIPSMSKGQYKNPKGAAWAKRVGEAEAFIFITPEYNHGPSAVLKNAVDWVYEGWQNKAAAFVSYGGIAAGTRAVQQLKQNLLNVRLYPIYSNVHIPFIWNAFDDKGQPTDENLTTTLKTLISELKDLQRKMKS